MSLRVGGLAILKLAVTLRKARACEERHTGGLTTGKPLMKPLIISIVALAAIAGAALAAPTPSTLKGHQLAARATVSLDEARTTALKARPGQITDQELETEKGGSGLRYSFDIRSGGHTFEVGVDARSGKVLEDKAEGAHPD